LEIQNIRTPEGVQERSVSSRTSAPSATRSGVEYIWDAKPRVVVAIASRPGANLADPSGIKKLADKVESLKALAQSMIVMNARISDLFLLLSPQGFK
jgi:hypothetical protein